MDPQPCEERFGCVENCVVVCACFLSRGIDEAVPIFLAVIEVYNMMERGVPNYGFYW